MDQTAPIRVRELNTNALADLQEFLWQGVSFRGGDRA